MFDLFKKKNHESENEAEVAVLKTEASVVPNRGITEFIPAEDYQDQDEVPASSQDIAMDILALTRDVREEKVDYEFIERFKTEQLRKAFERKNAGFENCAEVIQIERQAYRYFSEGMNENDDFHPRDFPATGPHHINQERIAIKDIDNKIDEYVMMHHVFEDHFKRCGLPLVSFDTIVKLKYKYGLEIGSLEKYTGPVPDDQLERLKMMRNSLSEKTPFDIKNGETILAPYHEMDLSRRKESESAPFLSTDPIVFAQLNWEVYTKDITSKNLYKTLTRENLLGNKVDMGEFYVPMVAWDNLQMQVNNKHLITGKRGRQL